MRSVPRAAIDSPASLDAAANGAGDVASGGHASGAAFARGSRGWQPVAVAAGTAVLMVTAYVLLAGRDSGQAVPAETPSVAVLPFADVSPNQDQGYFADGLSEELLNALGKLQGLRVSGRTSSFSFKGRNEDVREIAAALDVRHVLEGSVRRDGDQLRITAQLVDATSGSQLWAETYDRKLGDVFTIQKQVADSVAGTLQLELMPAHAASIAGETRNVEAYEAYLAARAVTNNGGSTEAREAVELLERAVRGELDKAEALLLASTHLQGGEALRRQGLIMIYLARHDLSGLRLLMSQDTGRAELLDDPGPVLERLRMSYTEATSGGAQGLLVPVAIFASFLGDPVLALDALRAIGPTQNLHPIWRPALSDVRRLPEFDAFVQGLGLVDYWRSSGNWGEFCREMGGSGFTCGSPERLAPPRMPR